MLNIIKGELYKLFRSKYFWVCNILIAALIFFIYGTLRFIPVDIVEGENEVMLTLGSTKGFIKSCFGGDITSLFIAILTCLLVVNEFRLATIKNMIPVNRRLKIYISKLLTGLVISFIFMLFALVPCLLIGVVFIGDARGIMADLPFYVQFILMQSLFCFATSSICIMLSFVARNIAVALPVCILLSTILTGVLQLLSFIHRIFGDIANYLPSQMTRVFIAPEAFVSDRVIAGTLACIIIIGITSLIGMLGFQNTDL